MGTPKYMVTVQEAAKRLNRSIEQVRRYLREGKLPGEHIGNQWFIRESAVAYWIGQREGEEVVTREPENRKTLREMSPQEQWEFFEQVDRRGVQIRQQWKQLGVDVDVAALIREIREEEP